MKYMKKYSHNNSVQIFGVNITFLTYEELLEIWFHNSTKSIASVNQHFLNLAYNDRNFREQLNRFDLVFPDGIGVRLARRLCYYGKVQSERTTFPDLLNRVFLKSDFQSETYYFFGATTEVIRKAVINITKQYPKVKIVGYHNGHTFDNEKLILEINNLQPRFLLVGLGGIVQEDWIMNNRTKLNIEKIIAIGGAFRVFANDRKRGPLLFRRLGLEWLIRLFTEPQNVWKRYLIGIPLFIFRIIKEKFKQKK